MPTLKRSGQALKSVTILISRAGSFKLLKTHNKRLLSDCGTSDLARVQLNLHIPLVPQILDKTTNIFLKIYAH